MVKKKLQTFDKGEKKVTTGGAEAKKKKKKNFSCGLFGRFGLTFLLLAGVTLCPAVGG
jgi:hypothetical protein